jgi:hypothetical protein
MDGNSLAIFDNYLLRRKNSRYDMDNEADLFWGAGILFCPWVLCLDRAIAQTSLEHQRL